MEKSVEKSFIQIGLYFQIAYIVLMATTLCGFIICYGVFFGFFYLLSGGKADYLVWILVIFILLTIFIIILLTIPTIVLSFVLNKESTSKGVILIVSAIISALLCNFVSAILWFVSAISILGRKESVSVDTITNQKSKGNANQVSHKENGTSELDSQDMSEHPEFKNVATKNNESSKQEAHTAGVESKSDSDDTEPPIEPKNHSSKKD
ncbi:MFS transporter [Staphylococcus roterodami]|nr:MFS transporter [Staphylococcus roterodami]